MDSPLGWFLLGVAVAYAVPAAVYGLVLFVAFWRMAGRIR